ncbi:MAG: hypothetical protein Q9175_001752 [Cornicularia normoerica]
MPYPMARPDDPVHLKSFDPKTFYPAIAPKPKPIMLIHIHPGQRSDTRTSSTVLDPPRSKEA